MGGGGSLGLRWKIQDLIYLWAMGSRVGFLSRAVPTGAALLTSLAPSLFLVPGAWWWWPIRPQNSTRRPTGPAITYRMSPPVPMPHPYSVLHAGQGFFPA